MTAPHRQDDVAFRWFRSWSQMHQGAEHYYAEPVHMRGSESITAAREAHGRDVAGQWVKPGMIRPHVSALHVQRGTYLLDEELARAQFLVEVGVQERFH